MPTTISGTAGVNAPSVTTSGNVNAQSVTTSGNIGAGTSTPNARLEIAGSVAETKATPTINSNTLTLDANQGTFFVVSLSSSITSPITVTNIPASPRVYSFMLQLTFPDNTARTVSWPTNSRWIDGLQPLLTCLSGKADLFTFLTHDGGTNWYSFITAQNQ
jgi:hypothetical protein